MKAKQNISKLILNRITIGTFGISKMKPYETSHSGLSFKIWHCLIFDKIKKNTCKESPNAHVL